MVHNPIVDLEKLVIDFVDNSPSKKADYPNAKKILPSDISWARVRIRHDDAEYERDGEESLPTASIVFSSTFENNTETSQEYTLKAERTTSTTCTYSLSKACLKGSKMEIKVTAPYIEVGAGIQREMTVQQINEQSFTQQLVWSIDNQVCVPSGYKTKADLRIFENKYDGNFTCKIHYSGSVNVKIRTKDSEGVMTVKVKDIFTREHGFSVKGDISTFTCEGFCKCRYGIEQKVNLNQTKIEQNGIEYIDS